MGVSVILGALAAGVGEGVKLGPDTPRGPVSRPLTRRQATRPPGYGVPFDAPQRESASGGAYGTSDHPSGR